MGNSYQNISLAEIESRHENYICCGEHLNDMCADIFCFCKHCDVCKKSKNSLPNILHYNVLFPLTQSLF